MNTPFVGMGSNPQGKDLPLGLGMQLAQTPQAMRTFGNLSQRQKDSIVDYVQCCTTSADAQNRIASVIDGLKNGRTSF